MQIYSDGSSHIGWWMNDK